jgi:hypothetical protein
MIRRGARQPQASDISAGLSGLRLYAARQFGNETTAFRVSFPSWGEHGHVQEEGRTMTTLKTVALAAALIAGATSLTMAQTGGPNGNNGMPPKGYTGPGGMKSYSSSEFQGNPAAYGEQSGGAIGNNGMPPTSYTGPGGMKVYK